MEMLKNKLFFASEGLEAYNVHCQSMQACLRIVLEMQTHVICTTAAARSDDDVIQLVTTSRMR